MADRNLSEVPTDELIRLARKVTEQRRAREAAAAELARKQGAVIAELVKRPGWTYVRVSELLGVDDSTAHRIARRATE